MDTDAIRRAWPQVLGRIFGMRRGTWTFVSQHAKVMAYDGKTLTLGISTAGLTNAFRAGNHADIVRQALIDELGVDAVVDGVHVADAGGPTVVAPPAGAVRPAPEPAADAGSPPAGGRSLEHSGLGAVSAPAPDWATRPYDAGGLGPSRRGVTDSNGGSATEATGSPRCGHRGPGCGGGARVARRGGEGLPTPQGAELLIPLPSPTTLRSAKTTRTSSCPATWDAPWSRRSSAGRSSPSQRTRTGRRRARSRPRRAVPRKVVHGTSWRRTVGSVFDVAADAYAQFMGRYSEPLAEQFVEWVGVRQGDRALDVGSGPGALTARLVERLGANAVSAVDPSQPFLADPDPAARPRRAVRLG